MFRDAPESQIANRKSKIANCLIHNTRHVGLDLDGLPGGASSKPRTLLSQERHSYRFPYLDPSDLSMLRHGECQSSSKVVSSSLQVSNADYFQSECLRSDPAVGFSRPARGKLT